MAGNPVGGVELFHGASKKMASLGGHRNKTIKSRESCIFHNTGEIITQLSEIRQYSGSISSVTPDQ